MPLDSAATCRLARLQLQNASDVPALPDCFLALSVAETYLPADLATAFRKATGITGQLYPWQADCLSQRGVLQVRPCGPAPALYCPATCLLPCPQTLPAGLPSTLLTLCFHLAATAWRGRNLVCCTVPPPCSSGSLPTL